MPSEYRSDPNTGTSVLSAKYLLTYPGFAQLPSKYQLQSAVRKYHWETRNTETHTHTSNVAGYSPTTSTDASLTKRNCDLFGSRMRITGIQRVSILNNYTLEYRRPYEITSEKTHVHLYSHENLIL